MEATATESHAPTTDVVDGPALPPVDGPALASPLIDPGLRTGTSADAAPTVAEPHGPITSPIPRIAARTDALPAIPPPVAPGIEMPSPAGFRAPSPISTGPQSLVEGPQELDPSLDPDRPQRPARPKPAVQVAAIRRRGRPRMRRVTRVVRHIDPWSVFKIALCFSMVLYGVCLTAGVLLWNVAYTTGTIDNVQRFFESFGWDSFEFKGGELYHHAWIAGLFGAIGLTGLIVLAATLFNLITDLVGGVRVTVLEEEVIERDPAARPSLLRRRSRHTISSVPNLTRERDDDEVIRPARDLDLG